MPEVNVAVRRQIRALSKGHAGAWGALSPQALFTRLYFLLRLANDLLHVLDSAANGSQARRPRDHEHELVGAVPRRTDLRWELV